MKRLAQGERKAVDEVYAILWPVLLRYCQSKLSQTADAQDAAQQALIKMIEQAPQYDASRPAMGWALSFAYWECRTEQRRRQRKRTDGEEPLAAVSTEGSPESELLDTELKSAALDLLSTLTDEERALCTDDETQLGATLRQLSPAARRKRKQRLLDRLRQGFQLILHPERGEL